MWNLPVVLERGGMIDVEQQLPLHRSIRHDTGRHALAQALPQQIAAIGQPLKRVCRRIAAVPEERVQHIAKGQIEVDDPIVYAAPASGRVARFAEERVDNCRIRDVIRDVLRKSRMVEELRTIGRRLPHEPHVYRFSTLHRDERRDLAEHLRSKPGVRIRERRLGDSW